MNLRMVFPLTLITSTLAAQSLSPAFDVKIRAVSDAYQKLDADQKTKELLRCDALPPSPKKNLSDSCFALSNLVNPTSSPREFAIYVVKKQQVDPAQLRSFLAKAAASRIDPHNGATVGGFRHDQRGRASGQWFHAHPPGKCVGHV
jgi:hypothetical protein